jgi:hypothetical protein
VSTLSQALLIAGVVALLIAFALPGWDTESLPRRAVKRRIYWAGTAAGALLLFAGGLPDVQSSVAFVLATLILMVGWAYFRTPHIRIGGQIQSADARYREPDPPPPNGT